MLLSFVNSIYVFQIFDHFSFCSVTIFSERRGSERSGVRSSLRSPCCILEQDTFTSQKVLVIPRKRWLHPDMTEKLLTGM